MPVLTLQQKLTILGDAAKYDASCASSGVARTAHPGGLGTAEASGICHSFTPDGRCVSLLKILMTNFCIYDCAYCINRRSSAVARARFSVDEVVTLTLEFYRRNYIEGLFLSSGIIRSPDATMEDLIRIVRNLREVHHFNGYIHLKTIPDASPELVAEAGRHADRLSINVELPSEQGMAAFAPQKNPLTIRHAMGDLSRHIAAAAEPTLRRRLRQRFAPAGQSTQMIIGADGANDAQILVQSAGLYRHYGLKRVYYSAFSPIPDASARLPALKPPLLREHRLYQADWLMRFYGYAPEEIGQAAAGGMLDLDLDPKLAWALLNRAQFPLDVNRAPRELLLRVPGLGVRSVERLLAARRQQRLRYADVTRLGAVMKKARSFIVTPDWHPPPSSEADDLRTAFLPRPRQLQLL
ncbi:MAG TPA: putative DNA modification/repair radical SAM protein [Aestuariivirga sp.]|nr:putative DNA modification/repair radical SAM protein [Aestuariivirga sp.]